MKSSRALLPLLFHLLLLRPFLRLVFGVNVRGRENLEGLERFILVSNHNSHLDVLLLYCALPARMVLRVHPVAAREYFAKSPRVFAWMNRLFSPVWVDRDRRASEVLAAMAERLEAGDSLIIFPEGTRGEPGRIGAFKAGIGGLVERQREVPVVPAFILGPERSLPRQARLPLPLWNHLVIGPPQRHLSGDRRDVTRALQGAVEELSRSQVAMSHRRRAPRRDAFALAVLGIDGSGKSTLSRTLAQELSAGARTCLISDALELFEDGRPQALQPLLTEKLREWIGRRAKVAGSLAGYKIPKLGEMLLRDRLLDECRRWYRPDLVVLDGCALLNLAAWSALYREECLDRRFCARALGLLLGRERLAKGDALLEDFPELAVLGRLRLNRLRAPDAVLFLDVSPAEAVRRIVSRGKTRQVHETEPRLQRLREAYQLVCDAAAQELRLPVQCVSGEMDRAAVSAEALAFVQGAREAQDGG